MIPVDVNRITEQTFLGARSSVPGSQEFVFLADRPGRVQCSDVEVTGALSRSSAGRGCSQDLSAKLQ